MDACRLFRSRVLARRFLLVLLSAVLVTGCATRPQARAQSTLSPSFGGAEAEEKFRLGRDSSQTFVLSEDASLDDLLRYAAKRSPRLRAAFSEWTAAVKRIPQARSLPDPNLSYAYYLERMDTRQSVGISQMFPWFGKRTLQGQVASAEAEAASARFDAVRLDLFAEVKSRYADYLYLEQALLIAVKNKKVLKQFEEVALARFRAGETGNADVLRVQMESERLADEVRSLEAMRVPTAAALNAALGRSAEEPLPKPQGLDTLLSIADIPDCDPQEWLARNPRLLAADYEVQRSELAVNLARRENRPNFTLGVEVMDNINSAPNEVMVTASISLPIWRERYAAARQEARAVREGGVASREHLQRELEAKLLQTIFGLQDAQRKVRLYGETLLPRAQQTLESLQAAYRTGSTDFIDLAEAQRVLLDVELNHQRALADQIQRLAELESLIGYDLGTVVHDAEASGIDNISKGSGE